MKNNYVFDDEISVDENSRKIVYTWFVQYAKLILFIHHEAVLSNIFEMIFNFDKLVGNW